MVIAVLPWILWFPGTQAPRLLTPGSALSLSIAITDQSVRHPCVQVGPALFELKSGLAVAALIKSQCEVHNVTCFTAPGKSQMMCAQLRQILVIIDTPSKISSN